LTKSKRHIKKQVQQHLKDGWAKQQIFDYIRKDLGSEIGHDYRQLKKIASIIRDIPRVETRRKLRLYKVLIIASIILSTGLQVYFELPYIQLLGLIELPVWLFIPALCVIFIFSIINILLIPMAIRYKFEAYMIICLLTFIVIIKDIWIVSVDYEVFGWLIILQYFFRLLIVVLSAVIWLRLPDSFSVEEIVKEEEKEGKLWIIKFK
jgi:Na+/melibiose symporter-like transporter